MISTAEKKLNIHEQNRTPYISLSVLDMLHVEKFVSFIQLLKCMVNQNVEI